MIGSWIKTHGFQALLIGLTALLAAVGFSFFSADFSLVSALLLILIFLGALSLLLPVRWMIAVLFLYLGFDGFFKIISGYNPFVHVAVDVYTLVILLKSILVSRGTSEPRRWPPLTVLFWIHWFWFFIAFLNPYQLSLMASLAGMKMYVTMLTLYFIAFTHTRSFRDVVLYMAAWIFVVLAQSIFSIYQGALGEMSVLSIHSGYAAPLQKFVGYAFRPFGFSAVAGGPAVFSFLVNGLILFGIMLSSKKSIRTMLIAVLALSWLTLFLCQVRSAILKAIVSSVAFFYLYFKYFPRSEQHWSRKGFERLKVISVVMMVVVSLGMGFEWVTQTNNDMIRAVDRSYTAFEMQTITTARRNTLERLWTLMNKVPFGAGLSRTGAAAGKFSENIKEDIYFKEGFFTDNFWLATEVDLGIPGMVILSVLVLLILIRGWRQSAHFHFWMLQAAHFSIWCCLLASFAGFYGAECILYNPEAAFFWFFAGVMMKLPVMDRQQHQAQEEWSRV